MSAIIQQNTKEPIQCNWLNDLADVITDIDQLFLRLQLDVNLITNEMRQARKLFPLRVPQSYLNKIKPNCIDDPLLLQVLSSGDELNQTYGFSADPLNEQNNEIPSLLHKYHNRVLLIFKTACAINCRYCFRRHFPYANTMSMNEKMSHWLDYIRQHTELDEVILSGGDPLMAKDHELKLFIDQLETISHIKRLRIHTRLAVVIPNRVTDSLLTILTKTTIKIILVTHINHPNEIDSVVCSAFKQISKKGLVLLNQTVLLKGINDNVETLIELNNRLFDDAQILPYYIHLLDKVQGAAHFYVNEQKAKALMCELASKISGYLLPKLVVEISGKPNKTIIDY